MHSTIIGSLWIQEEVWLTRYSINWIPFYEPHRLHVVLRARTPDPFASWNIRHCYTVFACWKLGIPSSCTSSTTSEYCMHSTLVSQKTRLYQALTTVDRVLELYNCKHTTHGTYVWSVMRCMKAWLMHESWVMSPGPAWLFLINVERSTVRPTPCRIKFR